MTRWNCHVLSPAGSSVDCHQSRGVSALLHSRLPRGGGGASSELKSSPPAGELMIKKRELYPQTPAPQSSTHSFRQIACISNSFRQIACISPIIYYFLQTACISLTEYGSDSSEDLHDVLHIQAICPSANTCTLPMILLLLWLLY